MVKPYLIKNGGIMKTVSVMVNGELAERARPVFRRYGFDLETALNAYLMQIVTDIAVRSREQEQAEYVRPPPCRRKSTARLSRCGIYIGLPE
jgi:hypothetical protein